MVCAMHARTHACTHAWPAVRTCTTGPRRRCLLDRRNLPEGEHVGDDSDAADVAWPSMPSGAERHRQHSQRLPAVGEQPGRRPLRALPRYTRMHARANAHARAQARTRGGRAGPCAGTPGSDCSRCDNGPAPAFKPPCDGCMGNDHFHAVRDVVRVPSHLPPGKYVLSWRYDCEATAQVAPDIG